MRGSIVAAALVALLGCDDGTRLPPASNGGGGSGGKHLLDAGDDADADGGGGARPDAGDAGFTRVLIGVSPSPRGDGDAGPTKQDEVDAKLTTLAAGVRVTVLARPWRALDAAGTAALADEVGFAHDHGLFVMVDVGLVNRAADGRPNSVAALPWDDPLTLAALDTTVDDLLGAFGSSLAYVGFGRDVDVYLSAHDAERDAFKALSTHACTYTRTHPLAPAGLHVGVGFSFEGATTPDPSFVGLLGAGDVAMVTYLRGLGDPRPGRPGLVASNLDAMIAHAANKPLALMSAGYPSSAAVGSSAEQQRSFYEMLFDAVEARRESVEFVHVVELHDASPAACQALAADQGEPATGPFTDYACSLGLFEVGDSAKPAWAEVLQGAARFASP